MDSNAKRGVISNGIGVVILGLVSWAMDLQLLALLALAMNWFVFTVHALPNHSEKLFDATGSLTYLSLAAFALASNWSRIATGQGVRQIVNPVMMIIWCIRLGSFLFSRILRDGKDSRFDELKKHWLRFLGIWTVQSVWCFFVASPVLVVVTSEACATGPSSLDILGWGVWLFGFAFEVIADQQKTRFRADPANKGKFITTGLWSVSRHPNYFGEIIMWLGICLSGSSCFESATWMAWLSPLTTTILLTRVSGVPMLEAQGDKRWGSDPAYQWYMKHTPCVVPALYPPPAYNQSEESPTNVKKEM
jgi:steroid 5-alpha reductase family enzyme